MALSIINDPYLRGGGGQQFGDQLGSGLSQLANLKSQQLQQRHQQNQVGQGLQALGISPQEANQLALLPPEIQNTIVKNYLAGAESAGFNQALGAIESPTQQPSIPGQPQASQQTAGQPRSLAEVLKNPRLTPEQRLKVAEFQQRKERESRQLSNEERKQQHAEEKLERPFYQKTVDDYKTSKSTMSDLDRQIKLINSGKIINPTEDHIYRWIAKTLRIPTKDLRGADTEEFEKLTAGFIKNAKNWFGGRVTNYDLESFMKTLPSLTTSHEGKLRLIGSMKAVAQAQQLKYDALKKLMADNGGRLPPYAEVKVNEIIGPQLDALADQFVSGATAPQLSEAGKESENRHAWWRYAKGGATALGQLAGALGGTVSSVGNALGEAAGILL